MLHTQAVSYDLNSYIPILEFGSSGYVICVRFDFPAKDGKEFIDHLKANPGKYTYAVDGIGNTVHLGAEVLFQRFGVRARAIPFNGASEQLRAILGTHVDILAGSSGIVLPHVKAGTLKCPMVRNWGDVPSAVERADGGGSG